MNETLSLRSVHEICEIASDDPIQLCIHTAEHITEITARKGEIPKLFSDEILDSPVSLITFNPDKQLLTLTVRHDHLEKSKGGTTDEEQPE